MAVDAQGFTIVENEFTPVAKPARKKRVFAGGQAEENQLNLALKAQEIELGRETSGEFQAQGRRADSAQPFITSHLGGGTPGKAPDLPTFRPDTPSNIDVSGTPAIPADRSTAAPTLAEAPALKEIAPTVDRFSLEKSQAALSAFDEKTAKIKEGELREGPSRTGESLSRFGSGERASLIRQNKQAFALLRGGSFADQANQGVEGRQNLDASARSTLAQIPNAALTAQSKAKEAAANAAFLDSAVASNKDRKKKGAASLLDLDAELAVDF